jgi:tRNA(Ile)-lysidine synthase
MNVLERVRRTIRQQQLADRHTRAVVAISGGSDSTALAYILKALDARGEIRIDGACHFNHRLRPAADAEERLCRELARSLGWPILVESEDVAARARQERQSLEQAGRSARHEFFERALRHFGADVVALGHTRDDQAETFLLRLLRGAGPRGLGGMHPRRGHIIRPLLDCRRAALRAYLDAQGAVYAHDASNDDVRIPRNRVRLELVPLLEGRFNPAIVDVLANEAELARDDWQWMSSAADEIAQRIVVRDGHGCRIESNALNGLPRALARVIVRDALGAVTGGRPVGFRWVEEALRFSRSGRRRLEGPGFHLACLEGTLLVTPREVARRRDVEGDANLFRLPLSIPGEVHAPAGDWVVSAAPAPSARDALERATARNRTTAVVQVAAARGPLAVRTRRPGDWFRPIGLGGRKKLQDYFVDRKIDRERRDQVPLVVDRFDRIVWVAGHAVDEQFRVTDPVQPVIILGLKHSGGPA